MFWPWPFSPSLIRASALALAVACGAAGMAQAADREPVDSENVAAHETYRKAIADGVTEYDAGHFEEALICFRRAHQISPNARTLRGMGKAFFELRNYSAAVRNLKAALDDSRKPLSDEQRQEVQDLLDRARLFVDVYALKLSPPNAEIAIDGVAAELQPDGTLMVGFGLHTIEVRAPGYEWRTQSLNVQGGERKTLVLTLDPVKPAEPVAPAPAPAKAPAPLAEKPAVEVAEAKAVAPDNFGAVMWFVGAGASALLAGGAGVYWRVQNSNVNKCRHPETGPSCLNESDIVRQRNVGAAVTIAAGAAAVTMATIGIFSWKSAPASSTQTSLACRVGPFGLACGGAF